MNTPLGHGLICNQTETSLQSFPRFIFETGAIFNDPLFCTPRITYFLRHIPETERTLRIKKYIEGGQDGVIHSKLDL
jgi:hypothetical protein